METQKSNPRRIRTDFKHHAAFSLHRDSVEALKRLRKRLPNYPKYWLVSLAIIMLEKEVLRRKITAYDDLEEKLN